MNRRYCIISPCRNEAAHMRRTLDSVLAQNVAPALWVIVDDGSTDATPAILAEYAARHDCLRVVTRVDRGRRSVGPGVVDAFYAGLETVDLDAFDYVCKLDLDLDLPPRYFARLMEIMEAEPRYGSISGKTFYIDTVTHAPVSEGISDEMSIGASKFYRTACFRDIGGLQREVMWDGIDCHRARMLGWRAGSIDEPHLQFEHLRPMGSSDRGVLRGRWRHGYGQYYMGTGLAFATASAVYRLARPPRVTGAAAMWLGYLTSALKRQPRYRDAAFRSFLRRYQRDCLLLGKREATRRTEARGAMTWHARRDDTNLPSVTLGGVPMHAITETQCVEHVMAQCKQNRGGWIVTINLDHQRRLTTDPTYAELCAGSTVRVADGMPIVWASRLKGQPLPQRVAGSDLISSLSAAAAREGQSVYLLGGNPGSAAQAADVLVQRHPNLRIAGVSCPPVGFDVDTVAADLIAARPDIVYVALGSPKQEQFIAAVRERLPGTWWIGVGISFSFLCGQVHRAPRWMQRSGLEWLHRLAQEPRRLARRYLLQGCPYALRLLTGAAMERSRTA